MRWTLRHTCPEYANAPVAVRWATKSRSASGATITGELLPSSSVTFLMPAARQDGPAHRGAAGEADLRDARVGDDRVADRLARALQQLPRLRRQAGVEQGLASA